MLHHTRTKRALCPLRLHDLFNVTDALRLDVRKFASTLQMLAFQNPLPDVCTPRLWEHLLWGFRWLNEVFLAVFFGLMAQMIFCKYPFHPLHGCFHLDMRVNIPYIKDPRPLLLFLFFPYKCSMCMLIRRRTLLILISYLVHNRIVLRGPGYARDDL